MRTVPPSTALVASASPPLRRRLAVLMRRVTAEVVVAEDGPRALERLVAVRPTLVVLDDDLGRVGAWSALRRLRLISDVPALLLLSSPTELEVVRALRAGADDCHAKPVSEPELVARCARLVARHPGAASIRPRLRDGILDIDLVRWTVTAAGTPVALAPLELQILLAFMRNPDRVLSVAALLEHGWGDDDLTRGGLVKTYVSYLRRKLHDAAGIDPIETVRGFGYRYRSAHASSGGRGAR